MRKLFFIALSLIFVLCSSFIESKHFVEVWLPVQDSSWVVVHYDDKNDSVYLDMRNKHNEPVSVKKAMHVSQRPSIKKIYKYSFQELDKLCELQKKSEFLYEKDAVIIVKHAGKMEATYKLKLSGEGLENKEKLKKLIFELK